jgi:hypothetical protein
MLGNIAAERAAVKSQSSASNTTAPQTASSTAAPPAANSSDITALVSLVSQLTQQHAKPAEQPAVPATAVPTTTAAPTGTITISKTMVMNSVLFGFIAIILGLLYLLSGRR